MASVITRDHATIQAWARARGAVPSVVVGGVGGLLRFEFPALPAAGPDPGWRDFFRIFDAKGLQLVFDAKPGSRFHKLIYPEAAVPRPASRPRRAA